VLLLLLLLQLVLKPLAGQRHHFTLVTPAATHQVNS
jgi:hypothetical protein